MFSSSRPRNLGGDPDREERVDEEGDIEPGLVGWDGEKVC